MVKIGVQSLAWNAMHVMQDNLKNKIFIKRYFPSAIVRFDKIRKNIEKTGNCLDLGCSIGLLTAELTEKCEFVVGVDVRKDAIKIAKSVASECHFIIGDATRLPFKNSVFNQVVSSEVIEHIKNYGAYIGEIERVSEKNAAFILTTPNRVINFPSIGFFPAPSISWILGKLTRNPLFLYPYGHCYGGFSPKKVKRPLERLKFRVEKTEYCGFALVKLIDDVAYIASVKRRVYDDIAWFRNPALADLGTYKKFLPLIKKLINIDSFFLKLGLEGYLIFIKARRL